MSLEQPALWWVPAVLVLAVVASEARRTSRISRLRRAFGRPIPRRGWIRAGLLVVAALGVGLAVGGPRAGRRLEPVPRLRSRVVFLVDVSGSMNVADVSPERMTRARLAAHTLAAEVEGARLGVAAFAAEAYTLLPPTGDRALVDLYLDALDPASVTSRGSRLAHAVRTVVEAFGPVGPRDRGRRAVVVFSDGEGFGPARELQDAARVARKAGVVVHGVLVGTAAGGVVPGQAGAVSRAREEALSFLASQTAGRLVRPGDASGFQGLVRALSVPPARRDGEFRKVSVDRTVWFAAVALLALCLEAAGGALIRRHA